MVKAVKAKWSEARKVDENRKLRPDRELRLHSDIKQKFIFNEKSETHKSFPPKPLRDVYPR